MNATGSNPSSALCFQAVGGQWVLSDGNTAWGWIWMGAAALAAWGSVKAGIIRLKEPEPRKEEATSENIGKQQWEMG